jgi:hypothetical protein
MHRKLLNAGRTTPECLSISVLVEFFHEHQQTLNCFTWFVTGETAPNQIDLFQLHGCKSNSCAVPERKISIADKCVGR